MAPVRMDRCFFCWPGERFKLESLYPSRWLRIMEAALAIQEFIEYVVVQLIDHPDEASVLHEMKGNRHEFRLRLHPDDVGRVIGKSGATISAVRNLAMAAALKNDLRISVEIEEPERS